jgi:hypothetical protein
MTLVTIRMAWIVITKVRVLEGEVKGGAVCGDPP